MAFRRRSEDAGHTHHQRCVFHAFSRVKRYTPPPKPRTQAGAKLYGAQRCSASPPPPKRRRVGGGIPLRENTKSGRLPPRRRRRRREVSLTHERLNQGGDAGSSTPGPAVHLPRSPPRAPRSLPATNNRTLKAAPARSSGPCSETTGAYPSSATRAIFRWSYMHGPGMPHAAGMLRVMPTDGSQ